MRIRGALGVSGRTWLRAALGALLAPFLVWSLLVVVAHLVFKTTTYWDIFLLCLSVAVGCSFLLRFPVHLWVRLLVCLVYVPLCFYAGALYGIVFFCYVFGECV